MLFIHYILVVLFSPKPDDISDCRFFRLLICIEIEQNKSFSSMYFFFRSLIAYVLRLHIIFSLKAVSFRIQPTLLDGLE